jgi:phage regulator Rha-like protein
MLSTQTQQSMSSLELATLVDKEHKNVIRDIRTQILEGLYSVKDGSDLSHEEIQGVTVKRDARGYTSEILLDRYHTDILVSGYEVKYRAAIVKRWHELEAQQKPLTQLEMLAQSVLAQVEQERRLTATEQKVEAIATKLNTLKLIYEMAYPTDFCPKQMHTNNVEKD